METNSRQTGTTAETPAVEPTLHRPSYVRVAIGWLKAPSPSPIENGAALARQCVEALGDREKFPPRLLIFLPTPSFEPYRPVLTGMRNELTELGLGKTPLIGASAAACMFEGDVHEQGALLLCLGSRLITARTATGVDAQKDWKSGVATLLSGLGLGGQEDLNPRGNRFLITFLPGHCQILPGQGGHSMEMTNEHLLHHAMNTGKTWVHQDGGKKLLLISDKAS